MFQERIQNHYEQLSPRFRTLADFILENTLDVGFMTATTLAHEVGADPATVVRFSQELGYSGFRELSREIKDYINNQLALRYGSKDPEDEGLPGEVTQLMDDLSNRILDMKVDAGKLVSIADLIRKADHLLITGASTSFGLVEVWAAHLRLIGRRVQVVPSDAAQAALALRDLGPRDLLIAVALGLSSGAELGPILQIAKERGAQTVSITANSTLLPAREADVNLVVPAKTPSGYPSFDTVAAVLSFLWQMLTAGDDAEVTDSAVASSVETLIKLVDRADKLAHYDSDALLRMWEKA